ncbi:DENN domain-containing protein 2A-like [Lutzomyia longipalpis]|uniref:DENN domain-containing protein 2A-like n=1 Tax=Lutzomyia longipalpis TaxID=7200 RepID=UPI0024841BA7|nr:DENN domain-containing protein 2A-like [Lutzomyia longipalpis]XP_055686375.1 DENN domain-containing protein 2A-like [Lutzomyia longipalpis]
MSGQVGTTRVQLMCTKFENLLKEQHQSRQTIPKVSPRGAQRPPLQRSATAFTLRRVDSGEKLSGSESASKRIKRSPAFREKLQARSRISSYPVPGGSPERRVEHSDTILRVLKHPLPKGPPPKKPPRAFESSPGALREFPSARPKNSQAAEHIYMEPFEHLRSHSEGTESPSAGSTGSTSSSREFRESPTKPELHYLCTDVTGMRDDERSFEKIYDQVGEIVTVAFDKSVSDANITLLPSDSESSGRIHATKKEPSTNLSRSCTEKRREYVRRTSTLYGTLHRKESSDGAVVAPKLPPQDVDLFRMCLLVEFNSITNTAHIKSHFPPGMSIPRNLEQLVFPCGIKQNDGRPVKDGQEYSLILTNDNGERLYGYCRRILPENSEILLPMAYCLLTDTKAPGFYFKLLKEIESRHGQTKSQFTKMLMDLMELKLPPPGQVLSVKLSSTSNNSGIRSQGISQDFSCISTATFLNTDMVFLRRPSDVRLESSDLWLLHRTLGSELLLHVFGTLLLERKVVLYSESISLVASCILALAEILYPFQWQYTLITVVPLRLLEICQAPFPVLVGSVCDVDEMVIDDGIVVNLDAKRMTQCCGDEMTLIPAKLRNSLLVSLEMYNALNEDKFLLSVLIAEAFLRFFIEIFDNFPHDTPFQKEKLINSHPNPSVQIFLEWFVETAMFHHFVKMRYSGGQTDKFYKIFEARLLEKGQGDRRKMVQSLGGNRKSKTLRERFREFFE